MSEHVPDAGPKVNELMSAPVRTVSPETPLIEVAATLLRHGLPGIVVTGRDGAVLGVITEADVIARAGFDHTPRAPWRTVVDEVFHAKRDRWATKAEADDAGSAMTAPAVTIGVDEPLAAAASRMVTCGLKLLPVVDDVGQLVGVVTQRDLLELVAGAEV